MTTARDYEFGDRPTCNVCGAELDPETDCYHDGYRGSPHAHNGNGSYGMGSHHFVFSELCENCSSRTAPLKRILQYNSSHEWLECGHKNCTPHDMFGRVRAGECRRCESCRLAHTPDFDPSSLLAAERRSAKLALLRAKNVPLPVLRHDSYHNFIKFAEKIAARFGFEKKFDFVPRFKNPEALKLWVGRELREEILSNDDH